MISNENKNLAKWAMNFALKNGCQEVKVVVYSSANTSFELRDAKMDRLQQSSEYGMSFSVYVDGRYGSFSTNRLMKSELESFIKNGIDSTRYLAADKYRSLADPSRYYKGGQPSLQLFDKTIQRINPDDKVDLARNVADEVMGKDKRVISVESSYGDGESSFYRLMSNGFEGEGQNTWCSLSASVALKGEGDARPSSYWYSSALYYNDLIKKGIGKKALERVLNKLGQKKIKSGQYTMVLDPMVSGQLLSPVIGALNGAALQQKRTFLLDKLDAKVLSDKMTLLDEPHLVKSSGARYFDSEGVATYRAPIFENGVLKQYFIDTYYSKKMEMKPTISSPSILVLKPGDRNLDELISHLDHAIYVTSFNGGNCNSTSGDFSYGVEGFLVENGKLTQPISEMNVTGNMLSLWKSLAEVGNDPRTDRSWRIPSLVFENVNFSGL